MIKVYLKNILNLKRLLYMCFLFTLQLPFSHSDEILQSTYESTVIHFDIARQGCRHARDKVPCTRHLNDKPFTTQKQNQKVSLLHQNINAKFANWGNQCDLDGDLTDQKYLHGEHFCDFLSDILNFISRIMTITNHPKEHLLILACTCVVIQ